LVIVSNYIETFLLAFAQESDKFVLGTVYVLVFIYQQMLSFILPFSQKLRVFFQQFASKEYLVIVINGIISSEKRLVLLTDFALRAIIFLTVTITPAMFGEIASFA